jgi:putative flavoprotein involved in K+ transport
MKMVSSSDAAIFSQPYSAERNSTLSEAHMKKKSFSSNVHTIVIGGGQAGLAVGYHLAKRKIPFLILDANARTGDSWRNRWDSLRLFMPTRHAALPGMEIPGKQNWAPTKDQMANYLEAYAKHFRFPVQHSCRVDLLRKCKNRFVVTAGGEEFEAENVVVAMSNYQLPRTPDFARALHPGIVQLHAHAYRNPSQLQDGAVLIVGSGNSGADIAIEVSRNHQTWLSGKESGSVPFPIDSFLGRHLLFRIIRFIGHHILTVSTPIGRKVRPTMLSRSAPLVRVKPKDLIAAGIKRVGKVVATREGLPLLDDDRTVDAKNVIWCTGYTPGFSWIDLPIFDKDGRPKHERGIVNQYPGLYFVGLHFLYAMSSASLAGVGRDAERIAKSIESRTLACENVPVTRLNPARAA